MDDLSVMNRFGLTPQFFRCLLVFRISLYIFLSLLFKHLTFVNFNLSAHLCLGFVYVLRRLENSVAEVTSEILSVLIWAVKGVLTFIWILLFRYLIINLDAFRNVRVLPWVLNCYHLIANLWQCLIRRYVTPIVVIKSHYLFLIAFGGFDNLTRFITFLIWGQTVHRIFDVAVWVVRKILLLRGKSYIHQRPWTS